VWLIIQFFYPPQAFFLQKKKLDASLPIPVPLLFRVVDPASFESGSGSGSDILSGTFPGYVRILDLTIFLTDLSVGFGLIVIDGKS
jgi:hypothetical protein